MALKPTEITVEVDGEKFVLVLLRIKPGVLVTSVKPPKKDADD